MHKLELYRRFAVAEVWSWRRGGLEIHALRADGGAHEALPGLDRALLERCGGMDSWPPARQAFRAGLGGNAQR